MTHNKYFFSGRMMAIRQKPEGGNVQQEYVQEGSTLTGPFERDALPLASSADAFGSNAYNLNPMLLEVIRMSDLFWDLAEVTTFEKTVDRIYYDVNHATPWEPGTHNTHRATGMQSAVRGVSSAGSAGVSYIYLLKLFIMRLTRLQVRACIARSNAARSSVRVVSQPSNARAVATAPWCRSRRYRTTPPAARGTPPARSPTGRRARREPASPDTLARAHGAPQIKSMLDSVDSPYIRCIGFLYLRVGLTDGYKEVTRRADASSHTRAAATHQPSPRALVAVVEL
eukprot:3042906-Prymnesium_polylepis.1